MYVHMYVCSYSHVAVVMSVVIGSSIHGVVVLEGPTIQGVGGKMMMGSSKHGGVVVSGWLYTPYFNSRVCCYEKRFGGLSLHEGSQYG